MRDVMSIYRELTDIRSRVERFQGQLNVLGNRTEFATVAVRLIPDADTIPVIEEDWRPGRTARGSASTLVAVLQNLADGTIYFGIVILPLSLIIGLPLHLFFRAFRKMPH